MNNILVCGGAGYIGAHMVKMLAHEGYGVVTFDNLSTGHREAVQWGKLVLGDLLDADTLDALFSEHSFDAVMHFSARSLVAQSVQDPALYYRNNANGTLNLLEAMQRHGVNLLVFSSTAAIFGNPIRVPIDENHPKAPINPYGRTKLIVEQILADYAAAYDLRSVSLRYFNAAGADPNGELGENHDPETHLIPNILKAVLGNGPNLKVFGDDYETSDGTCVRDYIHVQDLCRAHLLALEYLESEKGAQVFNLGNGEGFTVLEVIQTAERVTGRSIPYEVSPRRLGDPPVLVADARQASSCLNWQPCFTQLEEIIETAWRWHRDSQ